MKFILGGGLTALLARDILGSDWTIIPYGKSRFYTLRPCLVDNYVIKDTVIDQYMDQYALLPVYIRNALSVSGQLTYNQHLGLDQWINKLYGRYAPPHASSYYKGHMEYFAYGDCVEICQRLQTRYINEILSAQEKLGKSVVKISDHTITTDIGATFEYDQILSTIPLEVLLQAAGIHSTLPSRNMCCYHIRTEWDMEGANHILVTDPQVEFYKVTQVDNINYIFYANEPIQQPGRYFMAVLNKKFDLIGEVKMDNAIPCGPVPEFKQLTDVHIDTIGRRAVWDDCQDVGTVIKRLVKMSNKFASNG